MTFRLADPEFLLLGIPLLLLVVFAWRRDRRRTPALQYSTLLPLRKAGLVASPFRRWFVPCLRIAALALLVVALARPQFGQVERVREASGVDILLVLDVSGSMQAQDFELEGERVNRLTLLKSVASDFVSKRPSDRMGLLVFGEAAFTQCPLTLDHDVLLNYLAEMQIGMAGQGTAIGDGLGLAVKRLDSIDSESRIVVLITDGQNTAGRLDPRVAAKMAKQRGVKVYTIGVGKDGKVPFPQQGLFGTRLVMTDSAPIDMQLLNDIAQTTGGQSFRAQNTRELQEIYDTINALEKTEFKVKEFASYEERMASFAFPALLLLLCEALASVFRFTRRVE